MFLELKTSNYIHKYSQIAFASDRVANAKKGHAPFFSLVHPISFLLHTPYFCHPHRPTRMLVSTDADARIGRRGWFLLMFLSVKPLLLQCQTVAFAVQDLPFHISLPLFLAISSPVFLNQRCFHVVCILWLHSLKTVSLAYNNIMCASTMRCFNCKQLLKQT